MTSNTLFRLLQISDSAFPRGAFAHSLGLETFVQEEKISNADSLAEFIGNVLSASVATLDGVYLREAWNFSKNKDLEGLMAIDSSFSAARPVASLRDASKSVGRQFLRTAIGYMESEFVCRYEDEVRAGNSPGHYALAFGVATSALGFSCEQALESYCYGVVSGLVGAAVRLVPLGQTDGQRVTASLEDVVAGTVEEALVRPLEAACSLGPGHEIRAMAHQRLYTRLFVS
ncbi:MAG: urease accessory protein UreF [Nitrospinaceae bacterium]|jgi:urease accessory protein|nr:urease accessory protein UreF [Nitrospinaceae bacterium]MBT3821575.1 urease accessory protein UreF [Nitrospinaceae bacterium]MBT4429819.1 urease accessory protein UreF [Nitrospinaceae bacterium]MBT5369705.1 urease accessory protein UreF [Nitrospinaceae bacterium]MBT5949045.1 urease accessory protein UreF [Nitrospinaceae bacterium]